MHDDLCVHSLQSTYHFTLTSRSLSSFSEPPLRYYQVRSFKRSRSPTNAQNTLLKVQAFHLHFSARPAEASVVQPSIPVRPWLAEMPASGSTLRAPSYGSPILHLQDPLLAGTLRACLSPNLICALPTSVSSPVLEQ